MHRERPGMYSLPVLVCHFRIAVAYTPLNTYLCMYTSFWLWGMGGTLQDIMETQYEMRQLPKGQKFSYCKSIDSRKYSREALWMYNSGKCSLKASGDTVQEIDLMNRALCLCLSPRCQIGEALPGGRMMIISTCSRHVIETALAENMDILFKGYYGYTFIYFNVIFLIKIIFKK